MNPVGQLLSVQHWAQYLPCGGPPQQCCNPPQSAAAPEQGLPWDGSIIKPLIVDGKKRAAMETKIKAVFILASALEQVKKPNKLFATFKLFFT